MKAELQVLLPPQPGQVQIINMNQNINLSQISLSLKASKRLI
jgi:hypothetical protein